MLHDFFLQWATSILKKVISGSIIFSTDLSTLWSTKSDKNFSRYWASNWELIAKNEIGEKPNKCLRRFATSLNRSYSCTKLWGLYAEAFLFCQHFLIQHAMGNYSRQEICDLNFFYSTLPLNFFFFFLFSSSYCTFLTVAFTIDPINNYIRSIQIKNSVKIYLQLRQ